MPYARNSKFQRFLTIAARTNLSRSRSISRLMLLRGAGAEATEDAATTRNVQCIPNRKSLSWLFSTKGLIHDPTVFCPDNFDCVREKKERDAFGHDARFLENNLASETRKILLLSVEVMLTPQGGVALYAKGKCILPR